MSVKVVGNDLHRSVFRWTKKQTNVQETGLRTAVHEFTEILI